MKNRLLVLFSLTLLLFAFSNSYGQSTLSGEIRHFRTNKLLAQTGVFIYDENGKTLASSFSDENGKFQVDLSHLDNGEKLLVKVRRLGFSTFEEHINLTGQPIKKNYYLQEEVSELDEVIVKTDPPVQVKQDTIIFNADSFREGGDVVVEDLLSNLPGVEVSESGTIRVNGKEVEKVMVDNDDFFKKGYKILTKSMGSNVVEKIEVYQNYSENKHLKGIEESDKVALNLSLDEDKKADWFGNASLGGGGFEKLFHQNRINLMRFKSKSKVYALASTNNIGSDVSADIKKITDKNMLDQLGEIAKDFSLRKQTNIAHQVNGFSEQRSRINNDAMASVNAIQKISDQTKAKVTSVFEYSSLRFLHEMESDYYAENTSFVNQESTRSHTKHQNYLIDFEVMHEFNSQEFLQLSSSFSNEDGDISATNVFNSQNIQQSNPSNYQDFDNTLIYSNKITKNKVFFTNLRFKSSTLTEDLAVQPIVFDSLFGDAVSEDAKINQQVANRKRIVALESGFKNKYKKSLLEANAGLNYQLGEFNSQLSIIEENETFQPEAYFNNFNHNHLHAYVNLNYGYKIIEGLTLRTGFKSGYFDNRLNQISENQKQNRWYLLPKIGFRWEINNSNKLTASYNLDYNNIATEKLNNGYLMQANRSFRRSELAPEQLEKSTFVLNYQLGDFENENFLNVFLLYYKNHDFLTTNSELAQNFTLSNQVLLQDQEMINASAEYHYYIKAISSSLKLKGEYSKNTYFNIVNDSDLRDISSNTYSPSIELRSGFLGWFNFHIGTKFMYNEVISSTTVDEEDQEGLEVTSRQTLTNDNLNNSTFLDLKFDISETINLKINNERLYYGALDDSSNTYYFTDFAMLYKPKQSKFQIGLKAKNLFNVQQFNNVNISDTYTSTNRYAILPRIILASLNYRF
ncbi:MAG: hypothetical protein ACQESK_07470 [Bacteroidota bacterium]